MSKKTLLNEGFEALGSSRTPPINLAIGGQNGLLPSYFQYQSAAPYVKSNLIAVLVAAPLAMQWLPNPDEQIAMLKSLIEVSATKIEGISSTYSWDYVDQVIGNNGNVFSAVSNASMEPSKPAFTWPEKGAMSISRFKKELGRMLLMDPITGHPGIISSPTYIEAGSPQILPEHQSFTVLFIEPDSALTRVTASWLVTNMMQRSHGDMTGNLGMNEARTSPEVTIEYTGVTMEGEEVDKAALTYLKQLKLEDIRPMDLRLFTEEFSTDGEPLENGVTADVAKAAEGFLAKSGVGEGGPVAPETT